MSGDISTSMGIVPDTSSVDVNIPWENMGNCPDSTSDQDQEPQHRAQVANTQVGMGSPAHDDRQHTTNSGNKTPTVSSSYQDIEMVIGGKTLTVR